MSLPWYEMLPETFAPGMRSFMRLIERSTVDLPQPEGPIIAVIWLRATGRETPRTACDFP